MKLQQYLLLLASVSLFGCAQLTSESLVFSEPMPEKASPQYQPNLDSNSLHHYVEQLAKQLFDTAQNVDLNKAVAVGTFLPTDYQSGNSLPKSAGFGLQVQESLMTFATQAGLKVIEFKTMPTIKVGNGIDQMLSRQLDELNTSVDAEYFLAGTYTQQQNSMMVNVRLIEVESHHVVSAATDYIPLNSMWSHSKVTMKANQIYRSEY